MSYSSEVLADSPLLYWKLDETSGTTAADSSGSGRDGTHGGGVSVNQTSLLTDGSGKSASYDGTDDYTTINYASWMNSSSLTVECLFSLTATATSRAIVFRDNAQGATTDRHWNIRVAGSALRVGYWDSTVASGTGDRVTGVTITTGTTYHVAITFDDATKTLRAYVNGTEAPNSPWTYTGSFKGSTVQPIEVGRYNNTVGAKGWYNNGKVDEVAVYGTALSSTRIAAHYTAATSAGSPPQTVNLGVVSSATTVHALSATVGTVRNLGVVSESTTVHAVTSSVGTVVGLGVVTETTTVWAATAVEGQQRNFPTLSESTTVHAVVPLLGYVVAVGTVTETTTVHGVSPVEGEVVPLGLVVETTTVRSLSVTLGYGTTIPDVVDGGRHRGGVGYATWLPAVVPTPDHLSGVGGGPGGAGYAQAVDKALAFGPVTIVGTQPTFTVSELAEPRGRDRVVIGGVDVTYFRGAEVRVGNYQLMEPFGYGTATLEFPQVYPEYEAIGAGDLSWLAPGAKVLIQRVDAAGNIVATDYKGYLIAPNANTGTFTYEVGGEVTGPAALRWRPMPLFRTVEDIGRQMARALGFVGVQTPRLGPDTGIEVARVGDMTLLEYMQQLVGKAWTRDGNQWTVMPDAGGVYRTARKDRATVAGTVYLSASSAEADLRRDISEEPNRIFGTGVTPAGKRIRNGRYPGLDITGQPPSFPGNLTAGDTGDGVLALIRQLQVQGYLNAETAPGQYDADVTRAVREVQEEADLAVTGNVNSATWDAIFDNVALGVSLSLSRIEPMAQKSYTKRYRYSSSGAIKGRNPNYDPTRLKIDRSMDFGTGFLKSQMVEWAKAELVDGAEPNWVGTLTIHSGAVVAGDHTPGDPIGAVLPARDIKPGMNLSLPQFQGGVVVHVTAAQTAGDVVTLQVDTRARDAWNVAQVIERNRESRRDPARAFFRELASSKNQKDAIEEWSEVGGLIPDQDLVQGWNVFEVVAGQAGTVMSLRYNTNPNAESSVAVFGKRVWPNALQRLIGNPLSPDGSEKWADENIRRQLERDHGLLYSAGDDTDPGGYSPGYKSGTSSIFTGRFEDDASFAYHTDTRPILYVAVYVDRDCTIPGGRIMWPQLESGA